MLNEPNQHSSNLKLISSLFIAYWLLGLTPADGNITLQLINFKITNKDFLPWIAHLILFYTAWRFHLSSSNKLAHTFRSHLHIYSFGDKNSCLYKEAFKIAHQDYTQNHKKKFEESRQLKAKQYLIKNYDNDNFTINLIGGKPNNNQLTISYQVAYNEPHLPDNDFLNIDVAITATQLVSYKIKKSISYLLSNEGFPDYLLPWALFLTAIATSILDINGINFIQK